MFKQKGYTLIELMVAVVVILIVFFAIDALSSSSKDSIGAISAAEASGFQNVKVVSTHRFISAYFNGCDKNDWKATAMTATNPIGKTVTITVCEGLLFKGATIRHNF